MRDLTTSRLRLEPQTAVHADGMFRVLVDPAIYEYENEPPPSLEWLRTRFEKLESRRSADGREQWLNWVARLSSAELIGYVQATIHPDGRAAIAYVLSSPHWGKGLAREAVEAMIEELVRHYAVHTLSAVLKSANHRSRRLLERLGFTPEAPALHPSITVEPAETLMMRPAVHNTGH